MSSGQELPSRRLRPLSELLEAWGHERAAVGRGAIKMIATDVDGTLTRDGRLCPKVALAIAQLVSAGIEVVPISGRPAGEVLGLARYLPGVSRAIAENGLLEIVPDVPPRWIDAPTDVARLRATGDHLNRVHGAGLRLAADAFCRLGDVAYERDGRSVEELLELKAFAAERGAHLVWSNVHVHLAQAVPDKGAGLLSCLERWGVPPEALLTVGDAPNDAGLFVADRFGISVGTADVSAAPDGFEHLPEFVAAEREADAFLTLAAGLLGGSPAR